MSNPYRTSPGLLTRDVHLEFAVSLDEEYVWLYVTCDGTRYDFGEAEYTLLVLARQRLLDSASGLRDQDCGWIPEENLPEGYRTSATRVRSLFAHLPVRDPDNLVEHHLSKPSLRIGTGHLSTTRL
jgi:hypothetical protein